MSWLYEMTGIIFSALTPILHAYGLSYLYYPDVILMFVFIPLTHIMNDEDTKSVIAEEGWIKGVGHMIGIRTAQIPQSTNKN